MRIENLIRLRDLGAFNFHVVCDGESGKRLYCDGNIIVANADLELYAGSADLAVKLKAKSQEHWKAVELNPPAPVLSDDGLFGRFSVRYIRKLAGDGWHTWINEQYIRCFSADAEFRGVATDQAVCVFEHGVMVGILMPMKLSDDQQPVPFLEDDVLYHECPEVD